MELGRGDVTCHVVDGFARDAGLFGDELDLVFGGDADLSEGGREADFTAEILNFLEFFLRRAFKDELHESTEGDAVTVWCAVAAEGSQAIIEGVRDGETSIIGTDTRKIDIGLDDCIELRRNDVVLAGELCLRAVLAESLIAELAERHRGAGNATELEAGGFSALAGTSLEVGAEGVAHAGNEELDRRVRDDSAVDDDRLRILRIEEVAVEAAVIVIDDREAGARCVGSDDGRDDRNRKLLIVRSRLRGIDRGATTDADNDIDPVLTNDLSHLFNLAGAGYAAENLVVANIRRVAEAGFDLIMTVCIAAVGADEQPLITEVLHLLVELEQRISALNILLWCTHQS